jgi:hypothetical protein
MDSNTHSTQHPSGRSADQADRPPGGLADQPNGPPARQPDGPPAGLAATLDPAVDVLAAVATDLLALAAQDPDSLPDAVRAERVPALRVLLDRLEGQWLKELADVDALGAAGADQGSPAPSTASWLRNRLQMGASAAHSTLRTARTLFRGPLQGTGQALINGELSVAHARVLADGTHQLPTHLTAEAEPVLLEAARRLDPPKLRQAVGWLVQVADPDTADMAAERRHARRGLWLSPTWEGMVAVDGLLEPEAGSTLVAALEPLARPANAEDTRSGGHRTADALGELARRALEGGRLPKAGGVRPQLLVTVHFDALLGHPGGLGGDIGWAGPLAPEACRRLACDGAITRVVVSRQPSHGLGGHDAADPDLGEPAGLQERLRAAMAWLPPVLGGAPRQPLDVGRSTRVVQPAQRAALAVRDGGCVFPGCDRPLAWCEAHHLIHWLDGGPTDLANLALVCRAHHRAVHEGGWQLTRGPDGRFTATPPDRRRRGAA